MDEQPAKRRGRPRKIVLDAVGSKEVSQLPEHDDSNRPDGAEPDQGSDSQAGAFVPNVPPRGVTWEDMALKAHQLSLSGHTVTQIFFEGLAPPAWFFGDFGALTHSGSSDNLVVTSEGFIHTL